MAAQEDLDVAFEVGDLSAQPSARWPTRSSYGGWTIGGRSIVSEVLQAMVEKRLIEWASPHYDGDNTLRIALRFDTRGDDATLTDK